jgi:hypothetical protein
MNKKTLLAASVAIALTGCNGSGSSEQSTPSKDMVTITAIDGYLSNAVVFIDQNNDGNWNKSEPVIAQTNSDGKAQVAREKIKEKGPIGIQIIAEGSPKLSWLEELGLDPQATIDQDLKGQKLNKEVALMAPSSTLKNKNVVISPLSDLVASRVRQGESEDVAIDAVQTALGIEDSAEIFDDYVGKNKKLHKVAQVLTVSKADSKAEYDEMALKIADRAVQHVDTLTDEQLEDATYKPVITRDNNNDSFTITENHTVKVNADALAKLQAKLSDKTKSLMDTDSFPVIDLDIAELFSDKDTTAPVAWSVDSLSPDMGIQISYRENTLKLSSNGEALKAGPVVLTLLADDFNSDNKKVGKQAVTLQFTVGTSNKAPVVDTQEKTELQDILDNWYIQQGDVFEQSFSVAAMFKDADGAIQSYHVDQFNLEGLVASVDKQGLVRITGVPKHARQSGTKLVISAKDNKGAMTSTVFSLPDVKEGYQPPVTEPENGFTQALFDDNRVWKMGSLADSDGEIGYAMFLQNGGDYQFCWGGNDEEPDAYKTNISRKTDWSLTNPQSVQQMLVSLDHVTGYVEYEHKRCGSVTLNEGKLQFTLDGAGESVVMERLYHHVDAEGQEQLIMKAFNDELFWLDSSDTPFYQSAQVDSFVYPGVEEYRLMVEQTGVTQSFDGEDPILQYSILMNRFKSNGYYESQSIDYETQSKDDFFTGGQWRVIQDEFGNELLIQQESSEDQKKRHRYINRKLGDVLVGISWSQDNGGTSLPNYSLSSDNKHVMLDIMDNLPLIQE